MVGHRDSVLPLLPLSGRRDVNPRIHRRHHRDVTWVRRCETHRSTDVRSLDVDRRDRPVVPDRSPWDGARRVAAELVGPLN